MTRAAMIFLPVVVVIGLDFLPAPRSCRANKGSEANGFPVFPSNSALAFRYSSRAVVDRVEKRRVPVRGPEYEPVVKGDRDERERDHGGGAVTGRRWRRHGSMMRAG